MLVRDVDEVAPQGVGDVVQRRLDAGVETAEQQPLARHGHPTRTLRLVCSRRRRHWKAASANALEEAVALGDDEDGLHEGREEVERARRRLQVEDAAPLAEHHRHLSVSRVDVSEPTIVVNVDGDFGRVDSLLVGTSSGGGASPRRCRRT